MTGALEHPNVVPVYALGRDEVGQPLMAMKRVDGVSWERIIDDLDEHPTGERQDLLGANLTILSAVCQAISYAHSKDVIHRDLKPENVMVGAFGEVYVVDWGLAVSVDPNHEGRLPRVADLETIEGTPHYMPPEMAWADIAQIGKPSDVYMLGAILHRMLTGKPRNEGDNLVDALMAAYYVQPYDYPRDVPGELAALANRATQNDPDLRPADAAAFHAELNAFMRHRAAHQVTARAYRRLRRIEALAAQRELRAGDEQEVIKLLSEARFGFQTALRQWPESASARTGLVTLLTTVCQFELDHGHIRSAEAIYDELRAFGRPNPRLRAAFERAKAEHDRHLDDVQQLKTMRREHDLVLATARPNAVAPVLGVLFTGAFLVFAFADSFGWFVPHHEHNMLRAVGFTVVMIVLARWTNLGLPDIEVVRRLKSGFIVTAVVDVVISAIGALTGLAVLSSMALSVVGVGAVFLTMAALVDRRLIPVGPVFMAFAFAAVIWPRYGYYLLAAANIAGPASAGLLWQLREVRHRFG